MRSPSSSPAESNPWLSYGLGLFIFGAGVSWLWVVASWEGLDWWGARWTHVLPLLPFIGIIGGGGALLGCFARYWRTWRPVAWLWLTLAVGAACWAVKFKWEGLWVSFDWFSSLLVLLGGACFGSTLLLGANKPPGDSALWVLAAPFVVAGIVFAELSGNLGAIFGVGMLLLLSDALGRRIIELLFRGTDVAISTPGYLRIATGLGGLIALFRIIGIIGYVHGWEILIELSALALILHSSLKKSFHALVEMGERPLKRGVLQGAAYGLACGLALVFWMSALAPETGPDALGGRSALPVIWAREGSVRGVSEIFAAGMGIGGEILNLILLPFTGYNMAKIAAVATALALAGAWRTMAGRAANSVWIFAVLIFFSGTAIWWQFFHGFLDIPLAFICVSALGALLQCQKRYDARWLALTAFLGGTAAGIKLNGGAVLIAATPVILSLAWRHGHWRSVSGAIGWGTAGLSLAFLVPVIRSYWLTGNPIFPFANSIFRSPMAETALQASLYGATLSAKTLLVPFTSILKPGGFGELGSYHPLMWLFVAWGAIGLFWAPRSAWSAWLIAGIMWLLWALSEQNLRYGIPSLACTMVAVILSLPSRGEDLSQPKGGGSQLFFGGGVLLLIVGGIAVNVMRPSAWMWGSSGGPAMPLRLVTGQETSDMFLSLRLPSWALARVVNQTKGTKAVIWQTPWTRDHLYPMGRVVSHPHGDIRILKPLARLLPEANDNRSPAELAQSLREKGITHLMWEEGNYWIAGKAERDRKAVFSPEFCERYATLAAVDRGVRLYALREVARAAGEVPFERRPFQPQVPVAEAQLFGIEAKWMTKAQPAAYVDFAWFSVDDRLILFNRFSPLANSDPSTQQFWQTAPAGCAYVRVSASTAAAGWQLDLLYPKLEK
jgi:hypothetical protein